MKSEWREKKKTDGDLSGISRAVHPRRPRDPTDNNNLLLSPFFVFFFFSVLIRHYRRILVSPARNTRSPAVCFIYIHTDLYYINAIIMNMVKKKKKMKHIVVYHPPPRHGDTAGHLEFQMRSVKRAHANK